MTTFLLVRHADHDWVGRGFAGRLPDVSLNVRGREQARELVERLRAQPIDAIYCSPQPRTRQTAQPLAAARSLEIRVDPAFDEVDLGDWQGRTFQEVRDEEAWRHWLDQRSSARPPGGEAFADVARRATAGLHALVARHPDRYVLVLSHGDVIKAMIASCLGLSLDHLERFDIAPASVSVLAMGEGWSQLRLLNAQGPLH
ncbi:MAG TPA: histidine phosphatase family protein [Ramlibacter sp.]|nr:histidine phosphatase family protein [Ramlibacter sp.]